MMPNEQKLPLWALIGLGASQNIGYGTLYYAFSILVPEIARDVGRSEQWVFGAFSIALLAGSLAAPLSGTLADRIGAGRLMAAGSLLAAACLVMMSVSSGPLTFAVSLALTEVVSAAVLYATAFTAIVQAGGKKAQTSIVHLTLMAGFASSMFWPLTSWMHGFLSWREIYLVFAAMNLAVCFPVHLALARLTTSAVSASKATPPTTAPVRAVANRNLLFFLMLFGFAIEGYALSAILVHMVPLTQALGMGAAGLVVASLFGPSQVASRLINLVFGRELPQRWLAVIATALIPSGLTILMLTTPSVPGAILFAVCFGLGSGLTSIVSGTLPLELFGKAGYGSRMGWVTSAKQMMSAVAPLAMSILLAGIGVVPSIWWTVAIGTIAAVAFLGIVMTIQLGARASIPETSSR
ncbi:arsenite efflux MFS transporter ArsK [Neorhizobium galegae]|uniref:arsenite efflux MFS transporter ArsK n=1 Tax=Neorhizobium galegae TaxID=399 RepID=UPI001F19A234|nr:arsenite efflux MFS transporter ArsK [Neorhizobium galegae]UIK03782.1 arsenite efflux MFS transporter ArsK [Neorhizobium galegae]